MVEMDVAVGSHLEGPFQACASDVPLLITLEGQRKSVESWTISELFGKDLERIGGSGRAKSAD
jgi:hypothetical protein